MTENNQIYFRLFRQCYVAVLQRKEGTNSGKRDKFKEKERNTQIQNLKLA